MKSLLLTCFHDHGCYLVIGYGTREDPVIFALVVWMN
jgi:hypothetical protein